MNSTQDSVPSEPIYVTEATALNEIVADHGVVLVDFYADWCGPCQMMEPTMESIAAETNAVVVKVDVDSAQQLAAAYGVQGIPTLLLFANGSQAERLVGAQSESALVTAIENHST